MATMFPASPASFTTTGESEFFNFLKNAVRPDTLFTAWYSPDIKDQEPDFVLLSPDSGLVVFEIKDWLASQILEADPQFALLQIGSRQERRHQPLAQAKRYVHTLMGLLSSRNPSREAGGKSQIPCPVAWGAVFPHMRREEFHAAGLSKVMDESKILFWDELNKNSPFLRDASGQQARQWLLRHFPPKFSFQLTARQIDFIKSSIFPIVRIETPARSTSSNQNEIIRLLDHEQENLARSFGKGKTLIQGPAGSGKTLVLAHQAWNLPRMDKNIRRILFICFNLSLPQYIRRLLTKKNVPLGREAVDVVPFYLLCARILGENLTHSGEESDYYRLVVTETLEKLKTDHPLKGYWDAILVDEGQDFTPDMAQIIISLLGKDSSLVIAEDKQQTLYDETGSSWFIIENLRKFHLSRQYRSTRRIAELGARVLEAEAPECLSAEGHSPLWLTGGNPAAQIEQIADSIASLVQAGTPMNEIAVLYVTQHMGLSRSFPELMIESLEARGILAQWLSKDTDSKQRFDITTENVVISTIHSAKGLDFAHVFVIGLDMLNDNEKGKRLAHVGITRARESLTFSILTDSGLVPRLKLAERKA